MDAKQFLLKAKGCSGRGVRMRLLDPTARQSVSEETARQLSPEATVAEWRAKEGVAGIVATVLEVTEQPGLKSIDGAAWKKVGADHLRDHLSTYFNAKDLDALVKIFRRLHDIDPDEVDAILGEAQDVVVD